MLPRKWGVSPITKTPTAHHTSRLLFLTPIHEEDLSQRKGKTVKHLLLCLLLLPASGFAQTAVDRLTEQLDFLGKGTIDQWKYSTDMKSDPTRPGFSDTQWETLVLRQSIYPDSCWLRRTVVIPERMLGEPVKGKLRFLVSVDDYGYLWVNGKGFGKFPWDGEFDIATNARAGDTLVFVIKAINTGGPLRLLRAQLHTDASASLADSIEDFSLSLRVGQKLLSFDTYQTSSGRREDPGVDRSTLDRGERTKLQALLQKLAAEVNVDALRKGAVADFSRSVASVRAQLGPVRDFVKQFTLYFDANAHIDAAWLWRKEETVEVCKRTFSSVLNMMNQRPDFTYTQSSAAYYDWMQRRYPALFEGMKQRIKEGRWEVIGGMWVEPDCNLPSGESWSHHLLYAKRYFRTQVGADVKIGWNPDSFGYNANMPMFYRQAGIDAFITQKIGWNEVNVFPYRLFWWESPDGSRILSYFPFDYVNTINNPFSLVDWLRQFEANTGFRKLMILFGVGDHGGGPSLEMLQRIDRLRTIDIFPTIEHGTAEKFLTWLRTNDLSHVPTWRDELYLEYHQGTYTTQARMKQFNREEEALLSNAEKLSTLAPSFTYHGAELATAWKTLLFNQFHDILPGSSIHEVYRDATVDHLDVQAIGNHEVDRALKAIARAVNTSAAREGTPLLVMNTLGWERSDIVRLEIPAEDSSHLAIYTTEGKEVLSQIVPSDRYHCTLLFVAERVPTFGYALFLQRRVPTRHNVAALSASTSQLSSDLYTIGFDTSTGWIRSIRDLRAERELLSGPGNQLELLEDVPRDYDAWNIGWTGKVFSPTYRSAEVVENGPVRAVVRFHRDFLKPGTVKEFPTEDFPSSFFTQDVILYKGLDRIEFVTGVDWWEQHVMLKTVFPLAVTDTLATYEIPYGSITRSTQRRTSWEKAKVEVPASRWADISSNVYGVSLLNAAKYGYDITGSRMRLSLLRSPTSPDPLADRGKHSIAYALYPHAGRVEAGLTVQRGYEFNTPLLVVATDRHKGTLPNRKSFLHVEGAGIVLTTIKHAEDGGAWILQWYESAGKESTARLTLPSVIKTACLSDFLEEDGAPLSFSGNTVAIPTKPHATVTIKVQF
jgi:alpha-mannosidase